MAILEFAYQNGATFQAVVVALSREFWIPIIRQEILIHEKNHLLGQFLWGLTDINYEQTDQLPMPFK